MDRFRRVTTKWAKWLLIAVLAWWPFMAMHELGHVLSTWCNGGRVVHVELRPWRLSHTMAVGSSNRLMDVWAGPVVGVLLPLLFWWACAWLCQKQGKTTSDDTMHNAKGWGLYRRFLSQALQVALPGAFVFCCLGNGAYVAVSALTGEADGGELVALGAPVWLTVLLGGLVFALGLSTWAWLDRSKPMVDA